MISFMLTCGKWIVAGVKLGTGQKSGALHQVSDAGDMHWNDGSKDERMWTDLGYVWK